VSGRQDLQEITEVEVSPGGEWRVVGSEGPWHSILEDPSVPLQDVKVKPEPEHLKQEAGLPLPSGPIISCLNQPNSGILYWCLYVLADHVG
jgi:hypothetical protein